VRQVFQCEAARLERTARGWRVLDARGAVLSEAAVVVLANAGDATAIAGVSLLPLRPVRGQITRLPEAEGRVLQAPVCGDGYVTPALDGSHCVGATFDEDDTDCTLRPQDHAANLERLQRMLPGFAASCDPAQLNGWAGVRAMSPDRLPLAGPVAGEGNAGLFACVGLGARGLTWSALLGELLASYVNGDPLPVERHVADQLAPGRMTRAARPGEVTA
jgi:tRNA 5-methylaminomethyl-2-thiouridine biosynthesis bifunctional protein